IKTGEILALASQPSFDLMDFSYSITKEKWGEITGDTNFPFLNRATQSTYPPGSVFKIVTAYAAISENVINYDTKFFCPGYYKIGNRKFRCWKHSGHGWVDFRKSLVQSCDVYFYQIADRLGIDKLSYYMKMFGFGSETGFDLTEKSGVAPSREWKLKNFKKPWYKGETAIAAIGQGYLTVTPMQVNVMTAAIANEGTILKPVIVKNISNKYPSTENNLQKNYINQSITQKIKEALRGVVNDAGGTGSRAKSNIVEIAGKTGTAQVVALGTEKNNKKYTDHAWFTSYAPAEDPEIAVTVLIENGGKGGAVAAPIAKEIIETFYKLKNKPDDI
ncbi:MAG: penicillin-binding transpeptidase domain-containing protein, partial [Thermodesulfobacteriota bacterium]